MENTAPHVSNPTHQPVTANTMAALSYGIGLFAVVALIARDYQKNAFVRFSAIQSLMLHGAWLMGYLAIAIVVGSFSAVLGTVLEAFKLYRIATIVESFPAMVSLAFSMVMLATIAVLVVQAALGKRLHVPIVGDFAEQVANR